MAGQCAFSLTSSQIVLQKTLLANDTNTRIGREAPSGCPYCLYRPFFDCLKTWKTGNTDVHTNLFARAGQDYTITFIRQQSLKRKGFYASLTAFALSTDSSCSCSVCPKQVARARLWRLSPLFNWIKMRRLYAGSSIYESR